MKQPINAHTRRVRRLRWALPVVALCLIGATLLAVILGKLGEVEIAFSAVNLEDGRVVMKNPEVEGELPSGQTFQVTASLAKQDPTIPKIIEMEEVLASIPLGGGELGMLTALRGIYNSGLQTLRLNENIFFEMEDGTSITMQDAQANLLDGWLKTDNPVNFVYQGAVLDGGRMTISDGGKIVLIEGGVKAIIPTSLLRSQSVARAGADRSDITNGNDQ